MTDPGTYSPSPTRSFGLDVLAIRAQAAIDLVGEAMTIRQYGERAPGGNENWHDWERKAEAFLRSLSPVRENAE